MTFLGLRIKRKYYCNMRIFIGCWEHQSMFFLTRGNNLFRFPWPRLVGIHRLFVVIAAKWNDILPLRSAICQCWKKIFRIALRLVWIKCIFPQFQLGTICVVCTWISPAGSISDVLVQVRNVIYERSKEARKRCFKFTEIYVRICTF